MTTCPKGIPLTEKTGLVPRRNLFLAKWNTTSFLPKCYKQHIRNFVLLFKTDGSVSQHIQRFRQHLTRNKQPKCVLTTVSFALNATSAFERFSKTCPPTPTVLNQICKRNVHNTGRSLHDALYRGCATARLSKERRSWQPNIGRSQTFVKATF
jgi:hypothetical protein